MSNINLISTNIAKGLLAAQRKMEAVSKTSSNPYYKSKYADVNSFLDVVVPTLNEQGIVLLQPSFSNETGHWVQTILLHESGESLTYAPIRLVLKSEDMQQLGSAITYARRYSLQSLLGMKAEDDDGNLASNKVKLPVKATLDTSPVPQQLKVDIAAAQQSQVPQPAEAGTAKPRATFRKSTPTSASNGNGATTLSEGTKPSLNF